MSFGKRIKKKREEIGLSVDDLARKIGKNRATIYRYENDEITNPPHHVILALSDALNVSPAWIMGWERK